MLEEAISRKATALVAILTQKKQSLTCAESCTGGLLAASITEIPGASAMLERSWITYSNQAKMDEINVPAAILEADGAVSQTTACAMAEGALKRAKADVALAITGIAGPSGGSAAKPVGLVYIACATAAGSRAVEHHFTGNRQQVRLQAVNAALGMALESSSYSD